MYSFVSGSHQHNSEVKDFLKKEVEGSFSSEYTDAQIKCEFLLSYCVMQCYV